MTIECYDDKCPKHAIHDDPDGGPFCDERVCVKTKINHCPICGGEMKIYEENYLIVILECLSDRCIVFGPHETDIELLENWNKKTRHHEERWRLDQRMKGRKLEEVDCGDCGPVCINERD